MPTLHLLGTGAPVSDPTRTTTMLAVKERESTIVIDCGGDVIQRIIKAGIEPDTISALILTHEHIDHTCGFPLFIEKLWLIGRNRPIPVYGPCTALDQAKRSFAAYDTSRWEGLPDIHWHEVAQQPGATVLQDEHWTIKATPGYHSVPVIALRIRAESSGGTIGFSSDTEPCENVIDLMKEVEILLHEATGAYRGHSTVLQAADIARRCRVGRLVLIHIPADLTPAMVDEGRKQFSDLTVAEEMAAYTF